MLPRENFDKNGAIWCNLGILKYAVTKLKIINFKVNKSTATKVNCHNFSRGQSRCTCYTKKKYIEKLQGGSEELSPTEADEILKNQTKWRLFLYLFCFLAGLPRSPKL